MAFRVKRRKNMSVMRIGMKVGITVVTLYASGLLLTTIGDIMNGTASPFYEGLRLIGWEIGDEAIGTASNCDLGLAGASASGVIDNCVYETTGSGILAIIGILAMVWIIFEFINIT